MGCIWTFHQLKLDALSGRKQLRHGLGEQCYGKSLAPWAILSISGYDDTASHLWHSIVITELFKAWSMILVLIPVYDILISSQSRHSSAPIWHALDYWLPYASVTSNHGPRTIWSPVRFLAHKAEWSALRNFTSVLFSCSHQATGPVRLDTAVHLWLGRMIRRTPWVPRAVSVLASYGPRKGIFSVFHILRDPCGTRKGAVRHPYGHVRELMQPELTKIPHGCRIWSYGARTGSLRSPHG